MNEIGMWIIGFLFVLFFAMWMFGAEPRKPQVGDVIYERGAKEDNPFIPEEITYWTIIKIYPGRHDPKEMFYQIQNSAGELKSHSLFGIENFYFLHKKAEGNKKNEN